MKPPSIDQGSLTPAIEKKKSLAEEFTKEEIIETLSVPEKNIKAEIIKNPYADLESPLIYAGANWHLLQPGEGTNFKVTLSRGDSKNNAFLGEIKLHFTELPKEGKILFIAERKLETKGEGLGLDLECQLERLCKQHGILTIYNVASSEEENIGAYVWAKYGYEFADESQIENLRTKFYYFAVKQDVVITTSLENLKRPIDFALARGVTVTDRKEKEIGKDFLLHSDIEWKGKKDLTPDSQGTKDFIAYLKERGREDLIEKYYAEEK